ncbi:MAG: hypothetical protein PVJ02_06750 [Gemmatimonadota bacterium]
MIGRVREGVLAGLLVLGVTLAFHWLLYPRIADPDSFYHVAHAQVYASTSLLDSSFPWTAFSAIADQNADLWWGFHVLLVPFAPFRDPAAGIRVAAAVLTLAGLGLVAWLSFRHRLLSAPLWPLVFFLAVPNVLYRYVAVRPEVLSVPLALLLLSALARRQPVLTLALSAALTWVHLSMFWLGPGIGVVWALAVAADRVVARSGAATVSGPDAPRGWRTIPGLAVLVAGGTLLGWLLRPNPLGAARLAWIQIAKLLFEKTGGTPLTFAVDLAPLDLPTLWRMSWPLLVPWCMGLGWLAWTAARARHRLEETPRRERPHLWAAVVLAVGFLGLTLFVARRSLVHWAAFATVSLAFVVTHLTPPRRREGISRVLLFSLPLLFAFSLWRNALNDRYVAEPPDTLQEAATWLAANSRPGDLVFNTHWDTFGPLFARDRVNHYVGGMDPIFQYARSPALYWEFHHLSTDERAEATCPDPVCSDEGLRDTWDVLRRDFGARYVLVQPRRNPRLSLYLLNDRRYRLVLETPREAVFEVLHPSAISEDGGPGDAREPEGGS